MTLCIPLLCLFEDKAEIMSSRKRLVLMKHATCMLHELSIRPEEMDDYPILALEIEGYVANMREEGE